MKKSVSYSEALKEIETIAGEIEEESIDVDMLTDKVKTALQLIKMCKTRLKSTEEELGRVISEFDETKSAVVPEGNKKLFDS
ncbi:MAG: exodeoxyribonuclease VII small subunit [Nitrospirae bacterium]|nr:exodeoxyribonuclease VII small subunit [Nitrospirota bacterium]